MSSIENHISLAKEKIVGGGPEAERLAAIVSSSRDAIITVGLDNKVQTWNNAAERLFGYSPEEAVGVSVKELIVPALLEEEHLTRFKELQGETAHVLVETMRRRKDGNLIPVEVSGSSIRDRNGKVWAVSAIYRDLSERARTQELVLENEAFRRSIIEVSPDCVKIIDKSGHLEFMNQNGCVLMEIDDFQKLKGTNWAALWPHEERVIIQNAVKNAADGHTTRFEAFCLTAKGTPRWWDVVVSPIVNNRGEVLNIITSSRDISHKKSIEMEIRTSRRRLRQASNAAGLTYVEIDLQTGKIFMAENFWSIIRIKASHFRSANRNFYKGKDVFLNFVAAHDREKVKSLFENMKFATSNKRVDFEIHTDAGDPLMLECNLEIESDSFMQAKRAFVTILDITKRKDAENQIRMLMREVNHRSKNLLSVVLAVGRQTARKTTPGEFMDKLSERISSLSASQDLLVKNDWRGVSIRDLVQAQLAHFRVILGKRITLEGPDITITAAAAQGIGMALHELSTNSGKYGSLSHADGNVEIHWSLINDEDGLQNLCISWRERGGPEVIPPSATGFGHLVVGSMVESAVLGKAHVRYLEEGLEWELLAPYEIVRGTKG